MSETDNPAIKETGGTDLTLIVPVFNEVENLRPLLEEIVAALDDRSWKYEVLFVDDGSSDGSFELMGELRETYPQAGAIRFRRNFGQTAAFAAGFDHAQGQVIVTIDADRQNDPADVPALVEKLDEGYDVANGWRVNRQDKLLLRKVPSYIANRLIARSTGVKLHDRGCSLRAYRREVVRELRLYGEMHRFIPELASAAGFRMTEVPVNHRPRTAGTSKYGISRTFRVILDLMTIMFLRRYSARPMHLFGGVGVLSAAAGLLMGLYLAGIKIWAGIQGGAEGFRSVRIGDRPLLMLSILLIILGVQFLVMGLLAELMVRTYHESQNKPIYYVREIIKPG
ncbi:MAG: glycosyltransferase family 2 protein [Chloroflexota bacterium]|jgi:glycosyltransferase involved in cell wall biosynthesis